MILSIQILLKNKKTEPDILDLETTNQQNR